MQALVKYMEQLQTLEEGDPIFISHGDCLQDVEYLIRLIHEKFPGHEITVNYIGPVIGAHSGAGDAGALFQRKTQIKKARRKSRGG